MADQTLGNDPAETSAPSPVLAPSIADETLDLDALMSGDIPIRYAEKIARVCTEPWREATLDALEGELQNLTDTQGRPIAVDEALGGSSRTFPVVVAEYAAEQAAYAKAMKTIRVTRMAPAKWDAFKENHKNAITGGSWTTTMRRELVMTCAIAPVIDTKAKFDWFLEAYGEAAVADVALAAWNVNNSSGVDVPKSPLFSAAQKHLVRSSS